MDTPLPVFARHSSCTLCPLHTRARSVGIPTCILPTSLPPSPTTPAVLILGQNPGFNEDRAGTPFIGKSGDLLQRVYLAGISLPSLATIYLANTARCYHVDGEGPTNAHYRACRPYLLPELHALATSHSRLFILCLGGPATSHLHALLGRQKVTLTSSFSHQGTTLCLPAPSTATVTPSPSAADATTAPPPASTASSATKPVAPPHGKTGPSNASNVAPPTTPAATTARAKCATVTPAADGRGIPVTIFQTFHPAAVLRTNNLIYAVQGHLQLLLDALTNRTPVPTTPHFILPRDPHP